MHQDDRYMTDDMRQLVHLLHQTGCSLVVEDSKGEVTSYNRKGVRDLIYLLDNEPERLQGARVADKVIGKAAAGLIIRGGVKCLYAEILSRQALPLLDNNHIDYTYGTLVDAIVIPEGDNRCPLEQIVASATDAKGVESLLRKHFEEVKRSS